MSEYWNNGTIIFGRTLTPSEAVKITGFFSDFGKCNHSSIRLIEYDGKDRIELEDYLTGRGFCETLNRLAAYCRAQRIGIDEDSIISYYGDEDGGYDFINGELRCLDADHRALVLCPTEELFDQLFERFKTKDRVLAEIEAWCGQKE